MFVLLFRVVVPVEESHQALLLHGKSNIGDGGMIMGEYEELANEFCHKTGTKITFTFQGKLLCPWDKQLHNKYSATISRNGKYMRSPFWDSLYNTRNGIKPVGYDILACLEKYDPGDFGDFLSMYGYTVSDAESYREASQVYKQCKKQYHSVERVFGDVLDELREIC